MRGTARQRGWLLLLLGALFTSPLLSSPPAAAQAGVAPIDERSILEQLSALDRELAMVRDQREEIQGRLDGFEESVRRHEDDAAVAEAQLLARRPHIRARLGGLYRLHRRGLARIIFGAEDPAELRRRSAYLLSILRADLARMDQFKSAVAARATAQDKMEKDVLAMKALRAELQLREAEIREQRARRLSMLDDIRGRQAWAMRASSEYGQIRGDFNRRLDSLGGYGDGLKTQVNTINPSGRFRDLYGRLPWPTTGRLIRRFGGYTNELTQSQDTSTGILVTAEFGTPFRAVFDGAVKLADFVPGYGQTVVVEHGDYTTVYHHANQMKVRPGDAVRAGDVLGIVGNSGLTDGRGYVLGFEVRYNGTPQDPLPWLAPR